MRNVKGWERRTDYAYFNLEDVVLLSHIKEDPKAFLNENREGVIIDEVHHYPELFSFIQVIVDQHPQRKFILTGSSNFSLLQNITQSLAGRTALFTLLPLSLHELGDEIKKTTKGIHYIKNIFGERLVRSALIYDGDIEKKLEENGAINFRNFYLEV